MKEHMESGAARNSGGPEITPEMLESMPDDLEINGVKLDPLLRKHGVDAGIILTYLMMYGKEDSLSHAIEARKSIVRPLAHSFLLC